MLRSTNRLATALQTVVALIMALLLVEALTTTQKMTRKKGTGGEAVALALMALVAVAPIVAVLGEALDLVSAEMTVVSLKETAVLLLRFT